MPSKRLQGAIEILREHGPLTVEELGPRMAAIGATKARDPIAAALDTVRYAPRFQELADGRWLERMSVLETAVLLHRVTREERRRSAIRMDPDLSVLDPLIGPRRWWREALVPAAVAVGWVRDRRLDRRHAAPDRFLGISYDLARSLEPGDTIRAIIREASLTFEPVPGWVDPGDVRYPELEAVAGRSLGLGPDAEPTTDTGIHRLLFELAGAHPGILAGLREPVGAMFRRACLSTHRERVGMPWADWADGEWQEAAIRMVDDELREETRRTEERDQMLDRILPDEGLDGDRDDERDSPARPAPWLTNMVDQNTLDGWRP